MSCALTQSYGFSCDVGAGGLKEVYLIELENVSSITDSSGTLTAITKATNKVFRKYQLVQDTASANEELVGNQQNGTLYYSQNVTIVINKQNVNVRNEILLLAKNRLAIVAIDNNDTARLYGWDQGLRLTTGQAGTGTAWGDRNGYTLTFTGNQNKLAYFVDDDTVDTLETPGA
jgi:hypothetical protein